MKFFEMFQGMDGSTSSMRVLTALCVGVVMFVWADISIVKGELQPLSYEQVGIVLGSLGIKAYQRGKEGTPTDPPKPNP